MRIDSFAAAASPIAFIPAGPANAVDPAVVRFLRSQLADKYVVLIDCIDAGGTIPADVKDRLFVDLVALTLRGQAGGAITTKDSVAIVCGEPGECLTIRYLLCDAFSVFDIVMWPDKIRLCDNEFGIDAMETVPQEPSSILKAALFAGKDVGRGANVLSYGGRHADAMASAGFPVTYPLHGDSMSGLRLEERAAAEAFRVDLRQRQLRAAASIGDLAA